MGNESRCLSTRLPHGSTLLEGYLVFVRETGATFLAVLSNFGSMTVTYNGDPGRIYSTISVGGQTLEPVPGQSYEIDDPGDGRWASTATNTTTVKAAPVVAPEVDETAPETTTAPVEGEPV
jgi:hypothetical protein